MGWSACGLLRQIGDVGGALEDGEALGGGDFVRIVQVSIDFANKDAAVLVSGPLRDGHIVNAGHHQLADKEVAEAVEADVRQLRFIARLTKCMLERANR